MKGIEKELLRRKKISKKVTFFGILFAVLFLVIFLFSVYIQNKLTSPNSNNSQAIVFEIKSGESASDIAKNLQKANLISDYFPFILYTTVRGISDSFQAGVYSIHQNLTMVEIAEIITKGDITEKKITIPEGWDSKKIAKKLASEEIVSEAEFLAALNKDYSYDFLKDKPQNANLEGFLYPDTYFFSGKESAEDIVIKMLDNFNKKYNHEIAAKVKINEMSLYEILTLASIVEREVANHDDRKKVASVFLNRLAINMPLESCATIQYITGLNKSQFSYSETRVESPYNTYINRGLPPGPIGNPSMESVMAVLEPAETGYLYFLSANGKTYFSYTLDEHERKKSLYLK